MALASTGNQIILGTEAVFWGPGRAQVNRLTVFLALPPLPSPASALCWPRAVVCSTLWCPLMAARCSYTLSWSGAKCPTWSQSHKGSGTRLVLSWMRPRRSKCLRSWVGVGDGTSTNPSPDPPGVGRRTVLHLILLNHPTPRWTPQP